MKHLLQHNHYFSNWYLRHTCPKTQISSCTHMRNFFCRNSNLSHMLPLTNFIWSFALFFQTLTANLPYILRWFFLSLHIHRFLFVSSPVCWPTLHPTFLVYFTWQYSLLPDFSASKNFTFAATTPYTPSYPEPSFRYTFFCLQFLLMYTNSYAAQFTAITLRLRLFDIVP